MKCPNCTKEMELEEYHTDFLNNEEEIRLREHFWCVICGREAIKDTYYKRDREEVKYGR